MSVAPASLRDVGQALASRPEFPFVAATTGSTNLVAALICPDDRSLYEYLTGEMSHPRRPHPHRNRPRDAIRQDARHPHRARVKLPAGRVITEAIVNTTRAGSRMSRPRRHVKRSPSERRAFSPRTGRTVCGRRDRLGAAQQEHAPYGRAERRESHSRPIELADVEAIVQRDSPDAAETALPCARTAGWAAAPAVTSPTTSITMHRFARSHVWCERRAWTSRPGTLTNKQGDSVSAGAVRPSLMVAAAG